MTKKTLELRMRVYRHIINNYNEYTPFSEGNYGEIFWILKNKLEKNQRNRLKIKIPREYYEKMIFNKAAVEEAYVEFYSNSAIFHVHLLKIENQNYEFYIMSDNKILMIFFRKAFESSH